MLSQTPGFPFRVSESAGGGTEVSAVVVAGGGGDEAGSGADVAAVLVACFAFVRTAVDFMAASSAVTGSGVMTVVGATPASPD
jgi:hypothetical protein